MCKEYPGPRCSSHAKMAKDRAEKVLHETMAANRNADSTNNLAIELARRDYNEALMAYNATPDGIETLLKSKETQLAHCAKKKRDYQIEALNEIRSGRFPAMSSLLTETQSLFDKEEVETILSSVRRITEKNHLHQLQDASVEHRELSEAEKNHYYISTLNQYEQRLREAQSGSLTKRQMDLLTKLRQQKTPQEITSLDTYAKAFTGLAKAKDAMRKEIRVIAVLQDVSPQVAAAYHDAYREQFKNEYAHLPAKEQPNPPKEWVEGSSSDTGFQNDVTTSIAPSDPATMYATYRLRADMNAIPDYLKNSRNIATVNVEEGQVSIVLCNSKGKQLESSTLLLNDVQSAAEKLQNRIIVLNSHPSTKNWLSSLSNRTNLKSSVLPIGEFSSKHLNLPNKSVNMLCQAVNVPTTGPQADVTMKAYLAAKSKIGTQWKSKARRRQLPQIEGMPLASRWA